MTLQLAEPKEIAIYANIIDDMRRIAESADSHNPIERERGASNSLRLGAHLY